MPCDMPYGKALLIATDQWLNAACGGCPDETLSSRAHRRRMAGKPLLANVIDALLFFDRDHCFESYESERLRKQFPPELR